ncbi:MAG: EFR1 family ferrodoxin [Desulfocucumaceae bacterium]
MSTEIYYFTGTGNSLQVAKDIAAGLEDTSLHAINASSAAGTKSSAAVIGLVFPVYGWGMPKMAVAFLKNLELTAPAYIFAVTTCGSSPGGTLNETARLLADKGLKLADGFSLQQPSNYIIMYGAESAEKQQNKIHQGRKRTLQIIEVIKNKESHKPETSGFFVNLFGAIVAKAFRKNAWRQAKNFWADEKCNQCQLCVQICPAENITMSDKLISWGDKCEQCMACLQWCPQEAIQYKQLSQKRKRYHHPDIKAEEMLNLK